MLKKYQYFMFIRSSSLTSANICIIFIAAQYIAISSCQDYDNDAYPDEDNRLSPSSSLNQDDSHIKEKREDDSKKHSRMSTSAVIVEDNAKGPDATISHTPNTKVLLPVTVQKTPHVSKHKGKEKTVLSQKLSQKPSRVVVDVKKKKDKNNPGKKKWETDLVVEGKPKKVHDKADVFEDKVKSASKEIVEIEPEKLRSKKIEIEPEQSYPEEKVKIIKVQDSKPTKKIWAIARPHVPPPELVVLKPPESINKAMMVKVKPVAIDIENIGKQRKAVATAKESKHAIIRALSGGLTPNLIRWAEEAIAAGVDNIVNAVEDKYIGYLNRRTTGKRLKRNANAVNDNDDDEEEEVKESKVLHTALKKAAATLAASQMKAKTAKSELPSEALDSAKVATSDAEQGAGPGAGRDLIQQTLQIQKGLNLVMRAVLKEKEKVAADLARYQNKISFLLREMAGSGRRRRRQAAAHRAEKAPPNAAHPRPHRRPVAEEVGPRALALSQSGPPRETLRRKQFSAI